MKEIDKRYPASTWKHVYTDGSAENTTRSGGCGVYIKGPGRPPFCVSAPGGKLCSNFKADVLALQKATETLRLQEKRPRKVVFLTDSLSALQARTSEDPDNTLQQLIGVT